MPLNQVMTVGTLQRELRDQLRVAGIESAALDARVLLQHVLGKGHEYLAGHYDAAVTKQEIAAACQALERRLAFEPVSRIIGAREFYGREFALSPDVLDPRADTEILVETAISVAQELSPDGRALTIADLGTGSGVLVVTLLKELSNARAFASDISVAALQIARDNALCHDVANRVDFVNGSWLDGIDVPLDLIVSNPPYIETPAIAGLARDVRKFDPCLALDGGDDGLEAYRTIVPVAYDGLRHGGALCVEIGAGQENEVWDLFVKAGFGGHPTLKSFSRDLAGRVRVVTGWKS